MPSYKVFIDGSAGTTGLRIRERLAARPELTLLEIEEAERKNLAARAAAVNSADCAFLCLPDAAARELVPLVRPEVRLLDTSTAHRTAPGWVYGFPEIGGRRAAIQKANRVAVPGCHASGFVALVAPLVETGLLPADYPLTAYSLTGYSGGGKSMIAAYEAADRPAEYDSPRAYALGLQHKHLPEMQAVCGLAAAPLFCPIVADYYSGMQVSVPILARLAGGATPESLAVALAAYYAGESQVTVHPAGQTPPDGLLAANGMQGSDRLEIFVTGNAEQILLTSRFDNLGKGASGAAVQCMNLMLGLPETAGLA